MLYERVYRERKDQQAIRLYQPLKATSPTTTEAMVVSLCAAMLSSLLRENVLSLAAVNGFIAFATHLLKRVPIREPDPSGKESGQMQFLPKGYSLFYLQCESSTVCWVNQSSSS